MSSGLLGEIEALEAKAKTESVPIADKIAAKEAELDAANAAKDRSLVSPTSLQPPAPTHAPTRTTTADVYPPGLVDQVTPESRAGLAEGGTLLPGLWSRGPL